MRGPGGGAARETAANNISEATSKPSTSLAKYEQFMRELAGTMPFPATAAPESHNHIPKNSNTNARSFDNQYQNKQQDKWWMRRVINDDTILVPRRAFTMGRTNRITFEEKQIIEYRVSRKSPMTPSPKSGRKHLHRPTDAPTSFAWAAYRAQMMRQSVDLQHKPRNVT